MVSGECIAPITLKAEGGRHYKVPCGGCLECLKKKSNGWQLRIAQEQKRSTTAHFITLTYHDDFLPAVDTHQLLGIMDDFRTEEKHMSHKKFEWLKEQLTERLKDCDVRVDEEFRPSHDLTLWRKDLKDFNQKLRMRLKRRGRQLSYYSMGEYGEKGGRPHYHGIYFNLEEVIDDLFDIWGKGHVYVGDVSEKSIAYVSKYIIGWNWGTNLKADEFHMVSNGLGSNYVTDAKIKWHNAGNRYYTYHNGHKTLLPRYYFDKIFPKRKYGEYLAGELEKASRDEANLKKIEERLKSQGVKNTASYLWAIEDDNLRRMLNFKKHRQ